MELRRAFVTESCGCEAYSTRFSPDDTLLAVSSARGMVCVYNVATGQEAFRLSRAGSHPVKQVIWRPELEDSSLRTRGYLVGVGTDGQLRQWHVASNRLLKEWGPATDSVPSEEEQLFCADYATDASSIVAGGIRKLWVFDEETKKQMVCLQGGDTLTTTGHSSRVQAVKFHQSKGEPQTVISGGWDSSVQFWDLRVGHAVRAIHGPHVCGDALDIAANGWTLLTGSWRSEDPLELWDLRTSGRLEALPWRAAGGAAEPWCLLYAACFSRGGDLVAAGGSCCGQSGGGGEAKVLRRGPAPEAADDTVEAARGCEPVGTLVRFTCLSAHFGSDASGLVAFSGGDGRVRVLRIER